MALHSKPLRLLINYPLSSGKATKEMDVPDFNSAFGVLRMAGTYSSFIITGTKHENLGRSDRADAGSGVQQFVHNFPAD